MTSSNQMNSGQAGYVSAYISEYIMSTHCFVLIPAVDSIAAFHYGNEVITSPCCLLIASHDLIALQFLW